MYHFGQIKICIEIESNWIISLLDLDTVPLNFEWPLLSGIYFIDNLELHLNFRFLPTDNKIE